MVFAMKVVNNLMVNYGTEALGITSFSASVGVTLNGVTNLLGTLATLVLKQLRWSAFLTNGVCMVGLGTVIIIMTKIHTEASLGMCQLL